MKGGTLSVFVAALALSCEIVVQLGFVAAQGSLQPVQFALILRDKAVKYVLYLLRFRQPRFSKERNILSTQIHSLSYF